MVKKNYLTKKDAKEILKRYSEIRHSKVIIEELKRRLSPEASAVAVAKFKKECYQDI